MLSLKMGVGCYCGNPMSLRSWRIHVASFVAEQRAMYLASVDDVTTHVCLRDIQLMGVLLRKKINPLVDFQSSAPAQSESM